MSVYTGKQELFETTMFFPTTYNNRLKVLPALILVMLSVMLLASCKGDNRSEVLAGLTSEIDGMLEGEPGINPYLQHFDSMPGGGIKMKINPVGGVLARVFNDSNYKHIEAAEQIGISSIESLADAWEQGAKMVKIETCREYFVDDLSHSIPFLVPEAAELLTDIGNRFNDSLQARGGGDYRIKVTSVTRTPATVGKLKRKNRNATDNSAHRYGTTFDISYAKFICDSVTVPRTQEDLKNLLAEILKTERDEGRCFVKYERKQGCFHITARK